MGVRLTMFRRIDNIDLMRVQQKVGLAQGILCTGFGFILMKSMFGTAQGTSLWLSFFIMPPLVLSTGIVFLLSGITRTIQLRGVV